MVTSGAPSLWARPSQPDQGARAGRSLSVPGACTRAVRQSRVNRPVSPRAFTVFPSCSFSPGIYKGHCFRINHFPEDNDYDHDSSEYLLRKCQESSAPLVYVEQGGVRVNGVLFSGCPFSPFLIQNC